MATINENAARIAKELSSFSDYKEGSATAEYNAQCANAAAILERVKPQCATEDQRKHLDSSTRYKLGQFISLPVHFHIGTFPPRRIMAREKRQNMRFALIHVVVPLTKAGRRLHPAACCRCPPSRPQQRQSRQHSHRSTRCSCSLSALPSLAQ